MVTVIYLFIFIYAMSSSLFKQIFTFQLRPICRILHYFTKNCWQVNGGDTEEKHPRPMFKLVPLKTFYLNSPNNVTLICKISVFFLFFLYRYSGHVHDLNSFVPSWILCLLWTPLSYITDSENFYSLYSFITCNGNFTSWHPELKSSWNSLTWHSKNFNCVIFILKTPC